MSEIQDAGEPSQRSDGDVDEGSGSSEASSPNTPRGVGEDADARVEDAAAVDGAVTRDAELDDSHVQPPVMDAAKAEAGEDATDDVEGGAQDAAAPVDSAADAHLPLDRCSDADLAAWRAFQVSGALVGTLANCFARDPACARGACDLMPCLRAAAGVNECAQCVWDEVHCALSACPECSASGAGDMCRACACREGCVGGGDACNMGPIDICADCDGRGCGAFTPMDPALIMVVVGGL